MSKDQTSASLPARNRAASLEDTSDRSRLHLLVYRASSIILVVLLIVMPIIYYPIDPFTGQPNPFHDVFDTGGILVVVLFALTAVVVFIGIRAKSRYERHSAPRFAEITDPPGILYLRPFTEDKDIILVYSGGRDQTIWADLGNPKAMWTVLKKIFSREYWRVKKDRPIEIIAYFAKAFGKIAAIGEPCSPPILGADNVYVSDADWQEKVLALAKGSNLVILNAGTSPGVLWEVENMVATVPPSRLIILIPGMTKGGRRRRYRAFLEAAEHLFPKGLPKRLTRRVIVFNDDWTVMDHLPRQPDETTAAGVAWWLTRMMS